MYIQPKSFLSRLLGAAWTILLICVLLWLAACLLAKVWVWIVVIVTVVTLVRTGIWWRRLRREWW
jgi:CHASE2 domain-containing sensor protein